ncbi:MAG TPA: hypothetical protein VHT21_17705 [Stellaceae bacterium]|jgi:hypothetical protein|nr:hypothetical protein [Stellaceae bacterium]
MASATSGVGAPGFYAGRPAEQQSFVASGLLVGNWKRVMPTLFRARSAGGGASGRRAERKWSELLAQKLAKAVAGNHLSSLLPNTDKPSGQAKCGITSEAKSSRDSVSFRRSASISRSTPGVLILPDQIDGLGHGADKPAQWSTGCQPLALRRHRSVIAGKQPWLDKGCFDRVVIAGCGITMATQHIELMPYLRNLDLPNIAADNIAGIGQTRDRAQRHLLAATSDHHRWMRLLHRLRFEDRFFHLKIPTVEGSAGLGPHL